LTEAQLIELIKKTDFLTMQAFYKVESNLAQVSGHFGSIAEALEGQVFWNHTKKISEDLFQDYFNMSMQV
jgi:hypothetical protein